MITAPAGWRLHAGAHLTTLYPPGAGGRVRYHARLRPLMSFASVVETMLAGDPEFRVSTVARSLRVITDEGEYAAWTSLDGVREGDAVRRYIGAVFADEFVAVVDALAVVEARFAELELKSRELLQGVSLGMGTRRRRFLYDSPAGWQPLANGLVATWYPLDFPADAAHIVVYPADPAGASPQQLLDEARASYAAEGFVLAATPAPAAVTARDGLRGTCFRMVGRHRGQEAQVFRDLAVLAAPPYVYALRLEVVGEQRLDAHRAAFAALVASVQPVPPPGKRHFGGEIRASDLSDPWAT